jgi:subtilisin-like proprotein convertase family protein
MTMKTNHFLLSTLLLGLALHFTPSALAASYTASAAVGDIIPDFDENGIASTIVVSTPITKISDLQITLEISGGWNGDYYAYLRHGSSDFAVLLNQVGTSGTDLYGYGNAGFGPDSTGQPFTFSDAGTPGLHNYQAHSPQYNGTGQLTGMWQPDGDSFDSSFGGMDPNGAWTLFIADLSTVGVGTFENWSISFTGKEHGHVPDSGATFFLLAMSLSALTLALASRRLV